MTHKNAILAVSFGTSHQDTCERTIAAIERDLAAALPGWQLARAFTSGMIIEKLGARDNLHINTVTQALQSLLEQGVTHVLLQPTHILHGEEYDDLVRDAHPFRGQFQDLRIARPLLSQPQDYQALVQALDEALPTEPGEALCLMGHGTAHFADAAYAALDYHFRLQGHTHVHIGTVEGFPDLATLIAQVKAAGYRRAALAPLMVVAGDHATNDMAGDGDDSWKTAFRRAGIQVRCILRGIGEYPAVRRIYVDHALAALREG